MRKIWKRQYLRNTSGTSNKVYVMLLLHDDKYEELSPKAVTNQEGYLITAYGRFGKNLTKNKKTYPDFNDADIDFDKTLNKKLRKGYYEEEISKGTWRDIIDHLDLNPLLFKDEKNDNLKKTEPNNVKKDIIIDGIKEIIIEDNILGVSKRKKKRDILV